MADDEHYDVELNEGDLNMRWLRNRLNERWRDGWQLKQLVDHDGNAVLIFERRPA